MKTVVMLPTYNEAENIGKIIPQVLAQDPGIHVLVVDDSSPDGTADIAEKIAEKDGRVHVLKRKERGRGTAGIRGFKWAIENGFDAVVEMDADFSHDPKELPKILKKSEGFDVVIGSRYVQGGGTSNWSPLRKLISQVANAYARAVLGLKVRDCTGGYKLIKTEALAKADLENYLSDKKIYDGPETLMKLQRSGARMTEVPITFRERAAGQSKITNEKIIRNILNHIKVRVKTEANKR